MKRKRAQIFQLFARYLPPFFYLAFVVWMLVWEKLPSDQDPYNFDPETIGSTIFFFIYAPYLMLTCFFLPPLIYPSLKDDGKKSFMALMFAIFTLGIGPVILYWIKVDKLYTQYIQEELHD
jgi:hypothetical protein